MPFWGVLLSFLQPYYQPNIFAKIINFFIWSTAYIQYWIIGLVAVNRYTAICWPLEHQKVRCDRVKKFFINNIKDTIDSIIASRQGRADELGKFTK